MTYKKVLERYISTMGDCYWSFMGIKCPLDIDRCSSCVWDKRLLIAKELYNKKYGYIGMLREIYG